MSLSASMNLKNLMMRNESLAKANFASKFTCPPAKAGGNSGGNSGSNSSELPHGFSL